MPPFVAPKITGKTLAQSAQVDVTYEVQQYCRWLFTRVPSCGTQELTRSLHEVKFTGAATHMRNLVEFLTNGRPTRKAFETDIVADHYFENGWPRLQTPMLLYWHTPKRNEYAAENVNRHLSHLTTQRVTERRKRVQFDWSRHVNFGLVLTAFVGFVDDLRVEHPHRARWFGTAEDVVRDRLANMPQLQSGGIMTGATPNTVYVGTN